MGVFAGALTNADQPQADIDLFVTTDPTLTNLNPMVISNCINGAAGRGRRRAASSTARR